MRSSRRRNKCGPTTNRYGIFSHFSRFMLRTVFALQGRHDWFASKSEVVRNRLRPATVGLLASAYARSGQRTQALRLVDELKRRQHTSCVPAAAFVNAYLGLATMIRRLPGLSVPPRNTQTLCYSSKYIPSLILSVAIRALRTCSAMSDYLNNSSPDAPIGGPPRLNKLKGKPCPSSISENRDGPEDDFWPIYVKSGSPIGG